MLLRFQRMLFEKLHDVQQAVDLSDAQLESFTMIDPNNATPEEPLECVKNLDVSLMLDYPEFRQDLISHVHFRMAGDANVEATFSVNKANNPVSRYFHTASSH
jgi:hypothetical protein